MWDYYNADTESEESEARNDFYEEEVLESIPEDPEEMIYACRYKRCQNNYWCNFDVTPPQLDWSNTISSSNYAPDLPSGVTIKIVANPRLIERALDDLWESSSDKVFALDCEWRPSFKKGERNPVALLTIASTTHAVLIRLCRMRFRDGVLPDNLIHFFHEKHATFLGTGWTSDSSALEYSFGTPRETWDDLVDIQDVSREFNPNMRVNLRKMVQHYLGFNPPKGSQVTLGDWEAQWLSDAQINYAVLDALYVGEIFREMRSTHIGR